MIPALYRLLWRIAPPFIRLYLRRRARGNPAYLEHWDERFGGAFDGAVRGAIWIHAVSVGETRAAEPLIHALRRRFPDAPLLITQMTPTGRAAAQKLYPYAQCRYLPYDRPDYAARFLNEHSPRFGVLMETEIWPNLMLACAKQGVPLFLANARLSAKSLRGYWKVRPLVRDALASLRGCFAQTSADALRLRLLGAAATEVCGNTKYDVEISETMRQTADVFKAKAGGRQAVVCGSTRFYRDTDEAELLLRAWRDYRGRALLVLVPRHPERFDAVFRTASDLGFRVQRRSDGKDIAADTQVWLGDSMGELPAYYAMADAAFVGGSLVDAGGQNPIEPMACGVPVLFGPSCYNFADVCRGALDAGAAQQVGDASEWLAAVEGLLADGAQRLEYSANALAFVGRHKGAAEKTAEAICKAVQKP
ncbi:MAG: lipid IV(A) 3-deoxy-D-manno-octulosonic acid transferase [Neisseria sp.]|nr:lipid IV(A) 3-deoxy-D-manno-octulosonic acid transferase [Neisseria sp.]